MKQIQLRVDNRLSLKSEVVMNHRLEIESDKGVRRNEKCAKVHVGSHCFLEQILSFRFSRDLLTALFESLTT